MNKELFYFNDETSSELTDRIFELISKAKLYIKTGNFFFQDPKLKEALIKTSEKGVAIFVLSNMTGNENRSNFIPQYTKAETDPHIPNLHELSRKGIHVRCVDDLHAKFLICDGEEGLLMSANYTPNSLYGNPECGIDLICSELNDMEFVFDKLFTNADITKITEDGDYYRYQKLASPLAEDTFNQIGISSKLRLTVGSRQRTNLANCHVRTIYSSILDIINKAKSELIIVSWSFNQINRLEEFKEAVLSAHKRGVKIRIYYTSTAEEWKVMRSETQLKILLGDTLMVQLAFKFPYNHSKCVISEKSGIIFTANIDGQTGLTSGFELGCILEENQCRQAVNRIKSITNEK